jgi:hypothetical protein
MEIISVWHLVESGRVLRINSISGKPSKKTAVVFTKKTPVCQNISEDIRIASREVAVLMKLRKYLVLSPGTSVVTGPFTVVPVDMVRDGSATNLLINEKYYFLSFVPDIIKTLKKETTVLIPASSEYYSKDSINDIYDFLNRSFTRSVVISGEYSDEWYDNIKKICKCIVVNEVTQTALF